MKKLAALLSLLLLASVMQATAAGLISKHQAEQDALKVVGSGTVTQALKEKEMGRLIWSVDITGTSDEYEVWVDAHTGNILKIITQPLSGMKLISKQRAEQIALKAVGGGKVVQAQRDQSHYGQIFRPAPCERVVSPRQSDIRGCEIRV